MLYTEISGRFWLVLRQSVTSRSTLLRFGNFAEIQLGPRPGIRGAFLKGKLAENWDPISSPGDDRSVGNGIGPHFPGFLGPISPDPLFYRIAPLWLHLIEAWCGVEERKGSERERPPLLGVSPCPHPLFISHVWVRTRRHPGWGRSLVIYPAGRLGLGPDNRKRSQAKLLSFPVWPGRRKPSIVPAILEESDFLYGEDRGDRRGSPKNASVQPNASSGRGGLF